MAKGTIIFFFILTIIASLLFGFNIGKNLSISKCITEPAANLRLSPTTVLISTTPIPTGKLIIPSETTQSLDITPPKSKKSTSITTYTNKTCGFSFSYPGSFIRQKAINEQSVIFTDPENPDEAIASTCAEEIPRPPLPDDKIEKITLNGTPATLYHDSNQKDGSPRDEVIVKNPNNGMDIIIAGYGSTFQKAISSFKFVQ